MPVYKTATLEDTLYFGFGSNDTSGSGDDGATPVFDVRLRGAAAGAIPTLSGAATLLTHANYPDGSHEVAIAATAANGFAADSEYGLYCTLLVDGENPTGHVGDFRLVAEGSPAENTIAIAKAVWDRILSGALHNIPGSAGRRLRQLEPSLFVTWYVDGVGGNDGNDGDTPDDPFLTIGAALAVVGVGETIVVGPATYAEAALDLDVAAITLECTPGVIITGGGGTCLVVSAASCVVLGGTYLPGGAQIGIDVQATGDYAQLVHCQAIGCSVGYDLDGSELVLDHCRSISHSVTGFDVTADTSGFHECDAIGGGAAVRGFYLSVNTADNNHYHGCHTCGNTTAGFEVVAGADHNHFAFCAGGGGDGARADAGTDNSWGGFALLPLLTQADILGDATPFLGASIAAILADVTGIAGAPMRGTDNAALAATALSTAVWTGAMAAFLDVAISSRAPAATALSDLTWTNAKAAFIDAAISSRSSHTAANVRDAIIDDATRFSGADIAAILAAAGGLAGAAMRGTDNAALAATALSTATWTAARAAFLDELAAANIPADVDTLLARLTAIRAGYLDELAAANLPADVDTLLARLTAVRAAYLDVGISTRSTLTAAQVDVLLTAAHGAGAWTTGGGGDATLANQLAIIATGGPGPWTSGGAGAGANTVTLTIDDGAAAPVLGLGVTVWNAAETAVIGSLVTDASGEVVFYLDNGNYRVLTPDTGAWVGSGNNLVVAGATAATYSVTARVIAAPADPTLCRCYAFMREVEGGTVLGVDEGTLDAVQVVSRPAGVTIVYGDGVAARGTDAAGFVYLDIVRGVVVTVIGTWPDGRTIRVEVTVPDEATYDIGVLLQA